MAAYRRKQLALSPVEAARRYIAPIPGAVSGERGHPATLKVASALVWGFGLSIEEAFPLIQEWNATCQPPWSESDLRHKLEDALRHPKAGKERGHLLGGKREQGKGSRNSKSNKNCSPSSAPLQPSRSRIGDWIKQAEDAEKQAAISLWLSAKPGISEDALKQIGYGCGTHRYGRNAPTVVAFGVFSPSDPPNVCGCTVYRADGQLFEMGGDSPPVKVKLVRGSAAGIVGRYAAAALDECRYKKVIKAAGIPDHLAIQSALIQAGLCDEYISFTNSSGESENPDRYSPLLEKALAGAEYFVIADNDATGRKGAEKWAKHGLQCGATVRIVTLPEEVDGQSVKDARDFFVAGKTFADLRDLMEAASILSDDDFPPPCNGNANGTATPPPNRVFSTNRTKPTAEAFLNEFYTVDGIRTLYNQNETFYSWQENAYRPVEQTYLQNQMLQFLHDSFVEKGIGGSITFEPFPAKDSTVESRP